MGGKRGKWVDGGGVGEWGWEGIGEGKKMGRLGQKGNWQNLS